MKKFIIKTIFVILPYLLCFSFLCKYRYQIVPFESSISFDSKIYDLKNKNFKTIDNIAVGSSMTLNNLNTTTLMKYLKNETYYNVSSWGQDINVDYEMIKILTHRYSPHRIIMVTCANDFYCDNLDCKNSVKNYLSKDYLDIPYMMIYKINSKFYDSDEDYRNCRNATDDYTNLNYDECGGIELKVYGDNISSKRWNTTSTFNFAKDKECYESLIKICEYLKSENIDLLLINTPVRRHYYCNNYDDVEKHVLLCDSIVKSYGFFYSNEIDFEKYNDSLFSDCSHLNVEGAKLFTDEFCKKYFE
ncbi:MAG: hypothetical protein Q4F69_10015 [Bacteroidia bacterium]|nr:hypothetical protein [Bacteroidia bacterium]